MFITYQILRACNLCKLSKSQPDKMRFCFRPLRQIHTSQLASTISRYGRNIRPLRALLATTGLATRLVPGLCSSAGSFSQLSLRYVKNLKTTCGTHFTSPKRVVKGPAISVCTHLLMKCRKPPRESLNLISFCFVASYVAN